MGYVTYTELINASNISLQEFSQTQLEQLIDEATSVIDERTGRTWQGIQTITNELYNGDGSTKLWLKNTDIQSITALSIDEYLNGSFTSITVGSNNDLGDAFVFYDYGLIVLNPSESEVPYFIEGNNTVKVSYTYGNSTPTDDVKRLCINIVLNNIKFEEERKKIIDEAIARLTFNRFE